MNRTLAAHFYRDVEHDGGNYDRSAESSDLAFINSPGPFFCFCFPASLRPLVYIQIRMMNRPRKMNWLLKRELDHRLSFLASSLPFSLLARSAAGKGERAARLSGASRRVSPPACEARARDRSACHNRGLAVAPVTHSPFRHMRWRGERLPLCPPTHPNLIDHWPLFAACFMAASIVC